ncbi:MAG TPA: NAD(P)H-quinone oxidoreductase [Polyangiaceae bacterium]
MKAIVVSTPGGPETLELRDVPDPVPAEGEVVVDVRATALNRVDLLQRRGLYPPPPGASDVLGLECAGVVSSLGAGVSRVKAGDRVMALLAGGGYAERVAVAERLLLPIPRGFSFEQAAALPEAFLTASEALFGVGRVAPGELVLVHAAASGVGTAALQLARERGARIVAVASGPKLERLRALAPARFVDRTREDFVAAVLDESGGRGADVIVDFVGAAYAARHAECLAVLGRHVLVGLLGGAKAEVDFGRLLARRQSLLGMVMRSRPLVDKIAVTERFRREWLHRFDDGRLVTVVDSVFPLAHAARAHAHMETNTNVGKIVLGV